MSIEDVSPLGTDVLQAWGAFLARGEASGEYGLVRPDGSTVDVEFRAKANVVPHQHLSILRDVTERERVKRQLQQVNDRLRRAHEDERRIALTLQQSMLPAAGAVPGVEVATRYCPAAEGIKVCGDWYDVTRLADERIGVAVGDVMGHGLGAAGVMAQLSSALAAAMHASRTPAEAVTTLDTYARSIDRDLFATVVQVVLDLDHRTLTYSSAGHPPPLLLDQAGAGCFLDRATGLPLAVSQEPGPRPLATIPIPPGAVLVLFTDGLVERRTSDIDDGLRRLRDVATRQACLPAEELAHTLLEELVPGGAPDDDVALVVLKF